MRINGKKVVLIDVEKNSSKNLTSYDFYKIWTYDGDNFWYDSGEPLDKNCMYLVWNADQNEKNELEKLGIEVHDLARNKEKLKEFEINIDDQYYSDKNTLISTSRLKIDYENDIDKIIKILENYPNILIDSKGNSKNEETIEFEMHELYSIIMCMIYEYDELHVKCDDANKLLELFKSVNEKEAKAIYGIIYGTCKISTCDEKMIFKFNTKKNELTYSHKCDEVQITK